MTLRLKTVMPITRKADHPSPTLLIILTSPFFSRLFAAPDSVFTKKEWSLSHKCVNIIYSKIICAFNKSAELLSALLFRFSENQFYQPPTLPFCRIIPGGRKSDGFLVDESCPRPMCFSFFPQNGPSWEQIRFCTNNIYSKARKIFP